MPPSIEELDARHARAARDAARDNERLNKQINDAREAHKEEWDASESGEQAAQIAEAERVMRLPTPETLKEIGSVVPKDVTRFPSD
jgi:hypothetical protein